FPLGVVASGIVLWGLGKLFGFAAGVSAAILVVTYAQFPRLLQSVAALLQGLLMNPESLAATSLGPARFLDPEAASAPLLASLMRLDLFGARTITVRAGTRPPLQAARPHSAGGARNIIVRAGTRPAPTDGIPAFCRRAR